MVCPRGSTLAPAWLPSRPGLAAQCENVALLVDLGSLQYNNAEHIQLASFSSTLLRLTYENKAYIG